MQLTEGQLQVLDVLDHLVAYCNVERLSGERDPAIRHVTDQRAERPRVQHEIARRFTDLYERIAAVAVAPGLAQHLHQRAASAAIVQYPQRRTVAAPVAHPS